ncbi:MAG: zinc ABC transporter substrate-binding protein [Planctomycetes bacterium]|nr:zinc ABC transporter substrate-binding protein [Planctomycetota bacterium]
MIRTPLSALVLAVLAFALGLGLGTPRAQSPLRLVATTPNAGAIARAVGGEDVEVTVLARPGQDPHFVHARPGHVKAVAEADLLVVVGLDLEVGFLPTLIERSRNPRIRPGQSGYLDLSTAVRPLQVPQSPTDRAQGDVHPRGNPHYLVDPVSGVAAAELLAGRLATMTPARAEAFTARATALRTTLGELLVGPELEQQFGGVKLARLLQSGQLLSFLQQQEAAAPLRGLLARAPGFRGTPVVVDHDGWPYLTQFLGLQVLTTLEPLPGIPPTTRHLAGVVERCRTAGCRALISSPYFDPSYIDFVVREAGVRVATLAHQAGALDGTDDYVALVRHNVGTLLDVLDAASSTGH